MWFRSYREEKSRLVLRWLDGGVCMYVCLMMYLLDCLTDGGNGGSDSCGCVEKYSHDEWLSFDWVCGFFRRFAIS